MDRLLIRTHVNANVQGRCYAIDLESSTKPHAGVSAITKERVMLHISSIVGIASVPAQGSSIAPTARPSATKHVTVPVSGRKTAQHHKYLTKILAGVRAPIRVVNALIQVKYLIRKPANASVPRSIGATTGRCLTLLHVNVSVQLSRVPTAAHHMSTMTTTASASAHISHQNPVLMDRFGIVLSAAVNVQRS